MDTGHVVGKHAHAQCSIDYFANIYFLRHESRNFMSCEKFPSYGDLSCALLRLLHTHNTGTNRPLTISHQTTLVWDSSQAMQDTCARVLRCDFA